MDAGRANFESLSNGALGEFSFFEERFNLSENFWRDTEGFWVSDPGFLAGGTSVAKIGFAVIDDVTTIFSVKIYAGAIGTGGGVLRSHMIFEETKKSTWTSRGVGGIYRTSNYST